MTRASMPASPPTSCALRASAALTVIVTYAFRNATLPVVTTLALCSFLLGANVLVEKVSPGPASARSRSRR
jgi:peptide/nickel transport system permease protein